MRPPIWIIFAPLAAEKLKREIVSLLRDEDGDRAEPKIEVIPGRGRYAAAFTLDPMLTDVDLRLGPALAQRVDGPVWTTRPADLLESGEALGFRYQRDQEPEDIEDDYASIAKELYVPLEEEESPKAGTARSVVVIDGASPDEVRAAFPPQANPAAYRVAANRRGTMITGGAAGYVAVDLMYALLDRDVYIVTRGPAPSRFAVTVMHGGKEVGHFEADGTPVFNALVLADVDGARTPAEILQRLDVNPDLFR